MLAGLAIVILVVFAELKSLAMFAVGLTAAVVSVAAAYFFLSRRGVVRWLSLGVFVLVPIAVVVIFAVSGVLWVAIVSAGVWLYAGVTAHQALKGDQPDWRMPEYPVQPPARHPYLIMNPKAGGGKVEKFDLKRKAEALGAEVFVLDGSTDVAAVARQAVANGADLLGVAGGDGTQALVAGIAAEHDLPFLVISAGTRNHFALDLGLNREDPTACLGALADGVELRVDLGLINGQPFVNNASFGAYAQVVESPAYRGDKIGTTLNLLPDLLQGHGGARLTAQVDGTEIEAPQALLVSNNPYRTDDIAGLGRRARLDGGVLGVIGVRVHTAGQAIDLLRGSSAEGVTELTTQQIEITADAAQIPVGVDGEAVTMSTPVTSTTWPGALRVQVPRGRPGIPEPEPPTNWARLRHLASGRREAAEVMR
ncbi:diacylglycerol/lipid kinase family protein [Streptomyces sp. NPDC057486]|uniref:diacylglycerol/lipid kinase family protein n=1 Tax=Streptomyces sp. NPDC057486 TaxID=3346145 RepID=UPI0036C474AF